MQSRLEWLDERGFETSFEFACFIVWSRKYSEYRRRVLGEDKDPIPNRAIMPNRGILFCRNFEPIWPPLALTSRPNETHFCFQINGRKERCEQRVIFFS
jgi:hypothetical protein